MPNQEPGNHWSRARLAGWDGPLQECQKDRTCLGTTAGGLMSVPEDRGWGWGGGTKEQKGDAVCPGRVEL